MKIGFIGLAKMGFNMVQNLLDHNYDITAFDLSSELVEKISKLGAKKAQTINQLVDNLSTPRIIWLMVPAGDSDDKTIETLLPSLKKGDILIDGGNSLYKDSQRRSFLLKSKGINFLDVGTSGGFDGARNGACMMVGGDRDIFTFVEPLFKDL